MRLNNNHIWYEMENSRDIALEELDYDDELEVDQYVTYQQYLAWALPTVAICPVWQDRKTGTVVILNGFSSSREWDDVPEFYEYMPLNKRKSRIIMEDKELHANIMLGKSWKKRHSDESMCHFLERIYDDVEEQVQDYLTVGDGTLSHLRAAARLLSKIVAHYERKGIRLTLSIYGSDARRSKAYYWLAQRMGARISNVERLEADDPFFQYVSP